MAAARGAPAQAAVQGEPVGTAPSVGAPNVSALIAAMLCAEQAAEDPLWSSDWTNVPPAETSPAEVFAVHDLSTWLAGMEKRRDQAKRAGKEKLAGKIGREIVTAVRSRQAEQFERSTAEPCCDTNDDDGDSDTMGAIESVYSMDWSERFDKALPTAAVA